MCFYMNGRFGTYEINSGHVFGHDAFFSALNYPSCLPVKVMISHFHSVERSQMKEVMGFYFV